ncbi:MAG TPA: PKD domain-containing protein, partial [Puia sp.]|nr:PKD domain-containing protein [Puia sp.]
MNISKKILLGCLLFFCFTPALWARHIKGGEIYYTYLGPGSTPNSEKYLLTLRLFISCASVQGQLETTVNIGVFDNSDGAPAPGSPFTAPLTGDQVIQLSKPSPCIINPSPVCYRIRIYTVTIELPKTPTGWTAVFQRCCRIDDITNLSPNFNIGASYMCSINGTNAIGMNGTNSTPQFLVRDTVLICQHRPFTLNFGATDQEHDSLTYAFTSAFPGGSTDEPIVAKPSSQFQIEPLSYRIPFSGEEPLGPQVTIDPNTGVISGIAPAGGDYVVCVLLQEWRNGKVISQKPKDFIIHVDDKCDFAAADLKPSYITCDGLNYSFKNEAPASPLVHSYFWDFGVLGISNDTSNIGTPTYTFPDSGTYKVKLYVNKGEECSDSAETLMKVYPGFFPGFKSVGTCVLHPIQFFDTTKTKYGLVSNWSWDFGDHTSTSDTSNLQNPSWQYGDTGTKKVTFIVSNSKGCLDTVVQNVQVLDKPPIILPFSDTLICNIDTLQLKANGTGVFSWTPTTNMLMPDTENPLVFPKTTTTYTVTLDQGGCVNTDSILVRVVDHVTLYPGNDSTICLGDTITLNPLGDGLYFLWSPAATLNDPTLKNPLASPTSQTTYHVVASIGKCNTSGNVTIST